MNIKDFAARYGVEARQNGCGDLIIPGWQYVTSRRCPEYACHIFDNGNGRFGIYLSFDTATEWAAAKKRLQAAGFVLRQDAHAEGTLLFDPADLQQVRLALKTCLIRQTVEKDPGFTSVFEGPKPQSRVEIPA